MPDLRITWTCATCGDVETITARARRHSATIGKYIPRGWQSVGGAGGKPSAALCRKCRPPLRSAIPPAGPGHPPKPPAKATGRMTKPPGHVTNEIAARAGATGQAHRPPAAPTGRAHRPPAKPTGRAGQDDRCRVCLSYGYCYVPARCPNDPPGFRP